MIRLGLTGSIGMGKSTTAAFFRTAGVPVYDADAAVHALYQAEAVAPIEQAFPGVIRDGTVDRQALSEVLKADPAGFSRLEAIVHPLVRMSEIAFLARQAAKGAGVVVLDIPLLFETGGAARVDATVVVTATPETQRARVLARSVMDEAKFEQILARQMPDSEKRNRAHFLVDTSHGLDAARRQVSAILRATAMMTRRSMV